MFYPDQARYAKLAAASLGLEFIDLDDGNGYLFLIRGNGRELLSGAGTINSYPANNATSHSIARDKSHTKRVLAWHGLPYIPGRVFFVTEHYAKLRNPGSEYEDALPYARSLGFPVFCKPLTGSRGDFAEVVWTEEELGDYVERVSARHDAIIIERLMTGDEYRVLVYDGHPVYSAKKRKPSILADGTSSVADLLAALNRRLEGTGISSFTESSISGFHASDIPPAGTMIPLIGRSNVSALGDIESLDIAVPPQLATLATASCRALSLRLGAIDVFDVSPQRDLSDLYVIEVNSNPGVTALERAGHLDLIVELWKSMLRESLEL